MGCWWNKLGKMGRIGPDGEGDLDDGGDSTNRLHLIKPWVWLTKFQGPIKKNG